MSNGHSCMSGKQTMVNGTDWGLSVATKELGKQGHRVIVLQRQAKDMVGSSTKSNCA